jgi:hypothetical protein
VISAADNGRCGGERRLGCAAIAAGVVIVVMPSVETGTVQVVYEDAP